MSGKILIFSFNASGIPYCEYRNLEDVSLLKDTSSRVRRIFNDNPCVDLNFFINVTVLINQENPDFVFFTCQDERYNDSFFKVLGKLGETSFIKERINKALNDVNYYCIREIEVVNVGTYSSIFSESYPLSRAVVQEIKGVENPNEGKMYMGVFGRKSLVIKEDTIVSPEKVSSKLREEFNPQESSKFWDDYYIPEIGIDFKLRSLKNVKHEKLVTGAGVIYLKVKNKTYAFIGISMPNVLDSNIESFGNRRKHGEKKRKEFKFNMQLAVIYFKFKARWEKRTKNGLNYTFVAGNFNYSWDKDNKTDGLISFINNNFPNVLGIKEDPVLDFPLDPDRKDDCLVKTNIPDDCYLDSTEERGAHQRIIYDFHFKELEVMIVNSANLRYSYSSGIIGVYEKLSTADLTKKEKEVKEIEVVKTKTDKISKTKNGYYIFNVNSTNCFAICVLQLLNYLDKKKYLNYNGNKKLIEKISDLLNKHGNKLLYFYNKSEGELKNPDFVENGLTDVYKAIRDAYDNNTKTNPFFGNIFDLSEKAPITSTKEEKENHKKIIEDAVTFKIDDVHDAMDFYKAYMYSIFSQNVVIKGINESEKGLLTASVEETVGCENKGKIVERKVFVTEYGNVVPSTATATATTTSFCLSMSSTESVTTTKDFFENPVATTFNCTSSDTVKVDATFKLENKESGIYVLYLPTGKDFSTAKTSEKYTINGVTYEEIAWLVYVDKNHYPLVVKKDGLFVRLDRQNLETIDMETANIRAFVIHFHRNP